MSSELPHLQRFSQFEVNTYFSKQPSGEAVRDPQQSYSSIIKDKLFAKKSDDTDKVVVQKITQNVTVLKGYLSEVKNNKKPIDRPTEYVVAKAISDMANAILYMDSKNQPPQLLLELNNLKSDLSSTRFTVDYEKLEERVQTSKPEQLLQLGKEIRALYTRGIAARFDYNSDYQLTQPQKFKTIELHLNCLDKCIEEKGKLSDIKSQLDSLRETLQNEGHRLEAVKSHGGYDELVKQCVNLQTRAYMLSEKLKI
jgi:hypothetical protein